MRTETLHFSHVPIDNWCALLWFNTSDLRGDYTILGYCSTLWGCAALKPKGIPMSDLCVAEVIRLDDYGDLLRAASTQDLVRTLPYRTSTRDKGAYGLRLRPGWTQKFPKSIIKDFAWPETIFESVQIAMDLNALEAGKMTKPEYLSKWEAWKWFPEEGGGKMGGGGAGGSWR